MKRYYPCIIGMATALTATACGGEDSTGPTAAACAPETTSVTATVSSGPSIVFDWEPRCPMAMVLVEGDEGDVWVIAADEGVNSLWDGPDEARSCPNRS